MSDNLKNKMIDTLVWTSVDRFGQQFIQFFIGVLMARLLSPNEYTLIALVMIFITLSNTLVDGGMGSALVRKLHVDDTDYSTVFYFNIVISLLLYALLYTTAPLIADFYNQPQLTEIARVIFIAIILNAFYLIPNVKIVRKIDVKKNTIVNVTSVFVSGIIGITFALNKMGVWSLVAQQLSFQTLRVIIVYYFESWKPKFVFAFSVIKESLGFSINLLSTSILNNIFNYIYILVLGKFFPKQDVGLYYQANKLNDTTNYSFQVILGSTYNVFVKLLGDDERFLRAYRKLVKQSSVLVIPLNLFLASVAPSLIIVLLSDKWMNAIPYFQMLSIASLFNPLYALITSALNAKGKSKTTFRIEFLKKSLIVISIVICLKYGIIALLAGFGLANWISTLISIFAVKKNLNHYWKNQLLDIAPSLLAGVVIAALCLSLSLIIKNNMLLLLSQTVTALSVYYIFIKRQEPELISKSIGYVSNLIKLKR